MIHDAALSVVIQQTTIGKWESFLVTILGGLVVVAIPWVLKYFNRKFSEIHDAIDLSKDTADRVDRHHRVNKRRLRKIKKQLITLTTQLDRLDHPAGGSHGEST